MSRVIGRPGYGAAREAVFGVTGPILGALLVVLILAAVSPWLPGPRYWIATLAGIAVDAVIFRKDIRQAAKEFAAARWWWQGAEGERRVAAELNKLSDEYAVFHDFRFRTDERDWHSWNIDHIVIGPTGIFVLETKNYGRKRVRPASLDRQTRKNVEQADHAAQDLKDRLRTWSGHQLDNVFVEAWVVYAQDGAEVEQMREGHARVFPLRQLISRIEGRPKRDVDWDQRFRVVHSLCWHLPNSEKLGFQQVIRDIGEDHKAERARRDPRQQSPEPLPIMPTVCPACGAPLVQKTARRGPRKGKPFLGCSKWRETGCEFVHNIDEPTA